MEEWISYELEGYPTVVPVHVQARLAKLGREVHQPAAQGRSPILWTPPLEPLFRKALAFVPSVCRGLNRSAFRSMFAH